MKKLNELQVNGLPAIIWLVATAIIVVAMLMGAVPTDMTGVLAI